MHHSLSLSCLSCCRGSREPSWTQGGVDCQVCLPVQSSCGDKFEDGVTSDLERGATPSLAFQGGSPLCWRSLLRTHRDVEEPDSCVACSLNFVGFKNRPRVVNPQLTSL